MINSGHVNTLNMSPNTNIENTRTPWNRQIGRLVRAYPSLSNNDLNYSEGDKDLLVASLSKKLNKTEKQITDVMERV